MLIEFRVSNFRSLRDEQALSMVAAKDKTLQDTNAMPSGIKAAPSLLRSVAIYGPNAGGKSNLIKALQYMQGVVMQSAAMQPEQTFNVQSFRLDADSGANPTEFEVTFVFEGIRYQYGFALSTQRITSEHLLAYKSFKPQQWFKRHYDAKTDKDHYEFSSGLKGQKTVWESATRPNALFLSMAVQLNSEQLRPIFNWFANKLTILNDITPLSPHVSIEKVRKSSEDKQAICDFLTAADMSIADINIETRKVMGQNVHVDFVAGKTEVRNEEQEVNELLFHHATEKGKAVFHLNDESSGTRNLLFLTGPIFDILKEGTVLVVDELTSLHPLLVRRLIELFHNIKSNSKGAQLIFATHDTTLLDPDLFRRDQIWFVEKDREQASKLYPLSDFSPRNNEALQRGYLIGRYGALPFFSDFQG